MFYVCDLKWETEQEGYMKLENAETKALAESWNDKPMGVYEGDDWDSAVLIEIAYCSDLFSK